MLSASFGQRAVQSSILLLDNIDIKFWSWTVLPLKFSTDFEYKFLIENYLCPTLKFGKFRIKYCWHENIFICCKQACLIVRHIN